MPEFILDKDFTWKSSRDWNPSKEELIAEILKMRSRILELERVTKHVNERVCKEQTHAQWANQERRLTNIENVAYEARRRGENAHSYANEIRVNLDKFVAYVNEHFLKYGWVQPLISGKATADTPLPANVQEFRKKLLMAVGEMEKFAAGGAKKNPAKKKVAKKAVKKVKRARG